MDLHDNLLFRAYHWDGSDETIQDGREKDDVEFEDRRHRFVVRVYGKTTGDRSSCVKIPFRPYFYLEIGLDMKREQLDKLLQDLRKYLGRVMGNEFVGHSLVRRTNFVGACANAPSGFCKLDFSSARAFRKARSWATYKRPDLKQFEANVDHVARALQTHPDLDPCGLMCVAFEECDRRMDDANDELSTTCDVERWLTDITRLCSTDEEEEEKGNTCGLTIASFDVECYSKDGGFPDPMLKDNLIFMICTTFSRYPPSSSSSSSLGTAARKTAVVLGDFEPPGDCGGDDDVVEVTRCENEADLLAAWAKRIGAEKTDVLTGYNIWGFDMRYIHKRVLVNGGTLNAALAHFPEHISRARDPGLELLHKRVKCGGAQMNDANMFSTQGILQVDMYYYFRRFHTGLDSYKLDHVGRSFLDDKSSKTGLGIKEMFRLWEHGSAREKWPIVEYCVQDALLVTVLLEKVGALTSVLEMANVCRIPPDTILQQGEQNKVMSLILNRTRPRDMLCPSPPTAFSRYVAPPSSEEEEKLQGATVLEPRTGAYWKPVICLDFQSLYPSIMMAHNLCHSTVIDEKKTTATTAKSFTVVEGTRVTDDRPGVLPDLLGELQKKRADAKRLMSDESCPYRASVLNAKQLAYKVSMNSVYGFCGVSGTSGMLPCRAVAATVTAVGRSMLYRAKEFIEAEMPGAVVLYGDTDSLMVDFGVSDVEEAITRGRTAAERITALFRAPVKLCFEKCYMPYVLYSKKRYMGLVRGSDEDASAAAAAVVDIKGMQFIRRDNCGHVKRVCGEVVDILLREMNVEKAVEQARQAVRSLLLPTTVGVIPLDDFVITKSIKHGATTILGDIQGDCFHCGGKGTCTNPPPARKRGDAFRCSSCGTDREVAYKCTTSPAIKVALDRERSSPGSGPRAGDLVSFVYVKDIEVTSSSAPKKTRLTESSLCCEKARDPEAVRRDGERTMTIDRTFYYEHQLKNDMLDIFAPMFPDVGEGKRLEQRLFGDIVARGTATTHHQNVITDFFRHRTN